MGMPRTIEVNQSLRHECRRKTALHEILLRGKRPVKDVIQGLDSYVCYGHGLAGIGREGSRSICLGCSSLVGSWGRDWINSSSLIDYLNTLPPFI
jgi:hypothetical protein